MVKYYNNFNVLHKNHNFCYYESQKSGKIKTTEVWSYTAVISYENTTWM